MNFCKRVKVNVKFVERDEALIDVAVRNQRWQIMVAGAYRRIELDQVSGWIENEFL